MGGPGSRPVLRGEEGRSRPPATCPVLSQGTRRRRQDPGRQGLGRATTIESLPSGTRPDAVWGGALDPRVEERDGGGVAPRRRKLDLECAFSHVDIPLCLEDGNGCARA